MASQDGDHVEYIGSLILCCSGFLFSLAAAAVGLLGLLVLLTTSVQNGLNQLRWWIQTSVYSRP